MGQFENEVAGVLRSSEHVKETLLEEIRKSPDYREWVESVIAEERRRVAAEKPPITSAGYWKQSKILRPIIGVGGTLALLTGLSLADIIDPQELAHGILGTDTRVTTLVSGDSAVSKQVRQIVGDEVTSADSAVSKQIRQIVGDEVTSVITGESDAEGIAGLKDAIRQAVMERPFLVFHGWKPLELVPEESEYSESCQGKIGDIRANRATAMSDLRDAAEKLARAAEDFEKVAALNLQSQAERELERLFEEEKTLFRACRDELDDPEVSFSFYADFDRDTAKVLLRVLKYAEGSGLSAVNKRESAAFSASLTSVSLNNPDGPAVAVTVDLTFIQDGILEATIARSDAELVFNKSDPIYHLIVKLDRGQLANGGEGVSFVVGSVVRLN